MEKTEDICQENDITEIYFIDQNYDLVFSRAVLTALLFKCRGGGILGEISSFLTRYGRFE